MTNRQKKDSMSANTELINSFYYFESLLDKVTQSQVKCNRAMFKEEFTNSGMLKFERSLMHAMNSGDYGAFDSYAWMSRNFPKAWNLCAKFNRSKIQKRFRANKRIEQMTAYATRTRTALHFVTLTFSDNTFASTNSVTRRRAVSRILRESGSLDYYANIDYGAKNQREHYHALVLGDLNLSEWERLYGFVKSETVRCSLDDTTRISKYINKFSNHACKDGANADYAITKRGLKIYDVENTLLIATLKGV